MSYAGTATAATLGCIDHSGRAYAYFHHRFAGFQQLAWGVLFFLLAAVISLLNAGLRPLPQRIREGLGQRLKR